MTSARQSGARVIIFDIDGTLANADHRVHHIEARPRDWDAFFAAARDDPPHDEIVYLNNMLWADADNRILIVTGRPERERGDTVAWLEAHDIRYHDIFFRPSGDRREDSDVKAEILETIARDFGTPYLVFEDRNRVVEMWRRKGIKCLQVAPGDF